MPRLKPLLWVLPFVTIFLFAHGVRAEVAFRSSRGMEVGDVFEPRILTARDGREIRIPAKDGLTVVLFWATWSPRSRSALAVWEQYLKEYGDQPMTVVSVNADNQRMESEDLRRIDEYVEQNNVGLPVIIDSNLDLFNETGVMVNPTTLFFKGDGTLTYKLASFPTSAKLDLKEALELHLGIAPPEEEVEKASGEAPYEPQNNAHLYFNLALNLQKKGFPQKARQRFIVSLQRDPLYPAPLAALEEDLFSDGRTPEAEKALADLLRKGGLDDLADRYGAQE